MHHHHRRIRRPNFYCLLTTFFTLVSTCCLFTLMDANTNVALALSLNSYSSKAKKIPPSPATLPPKSSQSSTPAHDKTRRNTIHTITTSFLSVYLLPDQLQLNKSSVYANAIPLPFLDNSERRQLELCLVSILRVQYWADTVAHSILQNIQSAPPTGMTDLMKAPYLEARLGAKAILTQKIGGGANSRVYALSSIQLKECIKDAMSWYDELIYNNNLKDASITKEQKAMLKKQKYELGNIGQNIIESLAAVVEFDGLDNIQDPSPRSSLALSMYNDSKGIYVKRLLLEQTVPNCIAFVNSFGSDRRLYCERYIRSSYPNEIPSSMKVIVSSKNETSV